MAAGVPRRFLEAHVVTAGACQPAGRSQTIMKILTRLTRKLPQIVGMFGIVITAFSSPVVLPAAIPTTPISPTDLIATVTNCRQVELSWTGSADQAGAPGLKAYIVHRNDGIDSTIVATRTTFSAARRVTPSTALTYTVTAVDFAGNRSAASNAVTVTTPPCSSNEYGVGDFEGKLEAFVEDYAGGKSR